MNELNNSLAVPQEEKMGSLRTDRRRCLLYTSPSPRD